MDLCPKCRTALFLKRLYETKDETVIIKTCRNSSCSNYRQDVSIEKISIKK